MVVFPNNLGLVHALGIEMYDAAQKRARAAANASKAAAAGGEAAETQTASAAAAAAEFAAQRAAHATALIDLRTVAQRMGARYQEELEDVLASAIMKEAQATSPQTRQVRSGKPINAFEAQAWPAAFVQFLFTVIVRRTWTGHNAWV